MLKNSERNCNSVRSVTGNFLYTEVSKFTWPGPNNVARAAFPSVPGVGALKQLTSNHSPGVGSLSFPSHTRFGRFPIPVPDWLDDIVMPSGKPVCRIVMPFTC